MMSTHIATFATIFFSMILVNNYVLVQFLGICPFLGVSKKLDQATGMSIAVIFVEVLATAVTWPIYHLLLAGKVDFTYMETVVFILVIAALVQLLETVMHKYMPPLYNALGISLPLITTNCGVLGVTMNNISDGLNYVDSLLTALGCGLGFFLAGNNHGIHKSRELGAGQELRRSAHYAGFGFDRLAVVLRLLGRSGPAVRRLRREMQ